MMAERYKMPDNVAKALRHIAVALHHIEPQQKCESISTLPALIKELQNGLSTEIGNKLEAIEKKLSLPTPAQEKMEEAAKQIEKAAENIKTSIADIGNTITQVTDTSSQLANTATSYKDALLRSEGQQLQLHNPERPQQTDPKILRDVDRKSRQILIDTKDAKILEASLVEIKERVSAAINSFTNPPPPEDNTILEISKLRKGALRYYSNKRKW
jgi:DNA repair ATPase RecN